MGTVSATTAFDQCLRRCERLEQQYDELYARVEMLAKGDIDREDIEYAPEGSCLAFLRWEELRRSEALRRDAAENGPHKLMHKRLAMAKMEGFSEAVTHLAKLRIAYLPAELGEIYNGEPAAD